MNAIILILVALISTSVSFAQNYQTVNSKRITYFENQYHKIQCLRIDSINNTPDSIFQSFPNIRGSENWCFSPSGASWIGKEIIIRGNGLNIFFNRNTDSIFIKTTALLHDNWVAFTIPDSMTIIATIINHDTMSFLGQLDSVKSIGFSVYDNNMNPTDNPLNNMILKISKNFGFVTAFNFYLFPNISDYFYELFETYNLVGLSDPPVGVQNLTWFGVYDFQAGDELHILSESRSWSGWGGYFTSSKTIKKYLDRSDFADSIVYTCSLRKSLYVTTPDSSYYNYTDGTHKEVIRDSPAFDKLPGEPVIEENNSRIFSYSMTNGPFLTKSQTGEYWFVTDSCWQPPVDGGCQNYSEYFKGLGGPYYECDNFTYNDVVRLVYYKKGEKTWGSPLIITGIRDEEIGKKVYVFPNPANDYIIVQIKNYQQPVIFEIFDLKGQTILTNKIDSKESKIKIMDLKPGIYMYRINDYKGILKTGKLVIN